MLPSSHRCSVLRRLRSIWASSGVQNQVLVIELLAGGSGALLTVGGAPGGGQHKMTLKNDFIHLLTCSSNPRKYWWRPMIQYLLGSNFISLL